MWPGLRLAPYAKLVTKPIDGFSTSTVHTSDDKLAIPPSNAQ